MPFWENFAQGLEQSPTLGGGLLGIGLNAYLNRNKTPKTPAGGGGIPASAVGPVPQAPSGPPPVTGMAQPTIFAPGAKSQMDVTGMPQGPNFKFPSAMRAGMYPDNGGGFLL